VLYCRQYNYDGRWQRGTVACRCPRGTFSHAVVAAYRHAPGRDRLTSARRGTADSDSLSARLRIRVLRRRRPGCPVDAAVRVPALATCVTPAAGPRPGARRLGPDSELDSDPDPQANRRAFSFKFGRCQGSSQYGPARSGPMAVASLGPVTV
jgi:hypothetical protein